MPWRSQRKLNHARTAPTTSPPAHNGWRKIAAATPATAPKNKVSHAMRRSVCVAGVRLTGESAIGTSRPASGHAANYVSDSAEKSQRTKNQHEPGLSVHPAVEKITQHAAQQDRSDKNKRQLHRHGELVRKIVRFARRGRRILRIVCRLIVQRHSAPSA